MITSVTVVPASQEKIAVKVGAILSKSVPSKIFIMTFIYIKPSTGVLLFQQPVLIAPSFFCWKPG